MNWLDLQEEEHVGVLGGPAQEGACLPVVGPADIEDVVAAWAGVPLERLEAGEGGHTLQLVSADE
jgi:ATP-dependent Clp protease ATP-binding subunit ClpA